MTHPLVEEVMKKATIAWVTVAGEPPYGVWCLGMDGALYVVSGPGEQPAPGLAGADAAVVTARGDHGGHVASWPVAVTRVLPGSDEWGTVAPQLAGKRLNAPLPSDALVARWAAECTVSRLTPADAEVRTGTALPDDSGATPPRPSPATRPTPRPFRLHRVRRPPR